MNKLERQLSSFFSTFNSTLELVDELINSKSHAQEIIILTCARLDALASTSKPQDSPRRDAFISFVCDYGQDRDFFNRISVGDLYWDFYYHRNLARQGLLVSEGRFYRYSMHTDAFIEFIDYSDIPLVEATIEHMLNKTMDALSSCFRVKPGQSMMKKYIASMDEVLECIGDSLKRSRLKSYGDSIVKALRPLVNTKILARILYERYRSEVIHGGHVEISENKFFSETSPYWAPFHDFSHGRWLQVEFPAKYLKVLLERCITTYKQHLVAKGTIPIEVHLLAFGEEGVKNFRYIDDESFIERFKTRLKISKQ